MMTKSLRMIWDGEHVAHMRNKVDIQCLEPDQMGRDPLGTHKQRWEHIY